MLLTMREKECFKAGYRLIVKAVRVPEALFERNYLRPELSKLVTALKKLPALQDFAQCKRILVIRFLGIRARAT
jgi:hypothetical protein